MIDVKSVLVLGAGADQLAVITAAKRRRLAVAAVDPDPAAPGLALADQSLVADLADRPTVEAFARSIDPAAVLTFAADYPVPMVAALADELGLPGLPIQSVPALTDKLTMRARLSAAGVAVPTWRHVTGPDEAHRAWADLTGDGLGTDVVVKPRCSSGSRGVTAVRAGDVARLHRAVDEAGRFDDATGVLMEELVDGPEISVETVTVDGETTIVTTTDKLTTGQPDFVEIGHSQPAVLTGRQAAEVAAITTGAIAALGLDNGIGHVELRLTSRGPVVIEVAGRAGGGAITSDLVPLSTGIDMAELALDLALGQRPAPLPANLGGAAVSYLNATPGTVSTIAGIDRTKALPGVHRVDCWVGVGDRIVELRDARHRIGRVVAIGSEGAQALARAKVAARAFVIECDGATARRPDRLVGRVWPAAST